MKSLKGEQKYCLIAMLTVICLCEIFLKVNNMFIQFIGICLLPIIGVYVYLLFKNEKEKSSIK